MHFYGLFFLYVYINPYDRIYMFIAYTYIHVHVVCFSNLLKFAIYSES